MASSAGPGRLRQYPEPLIIDPRSGMHLRTFIILHGRGSNAEKFGLELLDTEIPGFGTLQAAFPDAKFIFPTAAKRRAKIYKRTPINQWFDNWKLFPSATEREELQFEGLRESAQFVHQLLTAEIAAVGPGNVVLWGLSQGCAMSLISTLLWSGEKFGALIGMCGWLPLRKRMEDVLLGQPEEARDDECDPFEQEELAGNEAKTKLEKVVQYLREEIEMSAESSNPPPFTSILEIPVFLGHGTEDEKVPVHLDREAAALLRTLQFDVEYKEYEGLGHWYSPEMLRDIVMFIERSTGWSAVAAIEESAQQIDG